MDADAGVAHLGCVYMKGDVAHCGFPERAYGKNVQKAIAAGLRVARVEQTETPEMMTARTGKKSGMVRREVCGIMSPGTRTLGVRAGYIGSASASKSVQLLAIAETEIPPACEGGEPTPYFGACVVDSTTGARRPVCRPSQRLGLRTLLEGGSRGDRVLLGERGSLKATASVLAHDAPPPHAAHKVRLRSREATRLRGASLLLLARRGSSSRSALPTTLRASAAPLACSKTS